LNAPKGGIQTGTTSTRAGSAKQKRKRLANISGADRTGHFFSFDRQNISSRRYTLCEHKFGGSGGAAIERAQGRCNSRLMRVTVSLKAIGDVGG